MTKNDSVFGPPCRAVDGHLRVQERAPLDRQAAPAELLLRGAQVRNPRHALCIPRWNAAASHAAMDVKTSSIPCRDGCQDLQQQHAAMDVNTSSSSTCLQACIHPGKIEWNGHNPLFVTPWKDRMEHGVIHCSSEQESVGTLTCVSDPNTRLLGLINVSESSQI